MLCVVCSRFIPIPIFRDENKLCKSCASYASQLKLKDNFMEDICTNPDANDKDLESVQRQLLHDLNLEEDSDYEAELNYLREAKKAQVLSKERKSQSLHPTERLKEYPHEEIEKLKTKTEILTEECVPESPNENKKNIEHPHLQELFSSFKFGSNQSIQNAQKLPQLLASSSSSKHIKDKVNRRVLIDRSVKFSILSVTKADEESNQSAADTFSIACRAVCVPTHKRKEPRPQFEKIHSVVKNENLKSEMLPVTGNKNPFICPVTFCKNIIPVSDILKHFKLNHTRVPIVPVVSGACTNLFWEAKVDRFGTSQCLMLLLSTGECEPSRDSLPVAIMTTKVKLSDLADIENDQEDGRHFHMIWLTAMTSSLEPVFYTITAWKGTDHEQVHIVNTTQSYSIRADQSPKVVYGSGMAMILTSEQINRLSNKNQDMVKLQVVVH